MEETKDSDIRYAHFTKRSLLPSEARTVRRFLIAFHGIDPFSKDSPISFGRRFAGDYPTDNGEGIEQAWQFCRLFGDRLPNVLKDFFTAFMCGYSYDLYTPLLSTFSRYKTNYEYRASKEEHISLPDAIIHVMGMRARVGSFATLARLTAVNITGHPLASRIFKDGTTLESCKRLIEHLGVEKTSALLGSLPTDSVVKKMLISPGAHAALDNDLDGLLDYASSPSKGRAALLEDSFYEVSSSLTEKPFTLLGRMRTVIDVTDNKRNKGGVKKKDIDSIIGSFTDDERNLPSSKFSSLVLSKEIAAMSEENAIMASALMLLSPFARTLSSLTDGVDDRSDEVRLATMTMTVKSVLDADILTDVVLNQGSIDGNCEHVIENFTKVVSIEDEAEPVGVLNEASVVEAESLFDSLQG